MVDAGDMAIDWTKLGLMAEVFANPTTFEYHTGYDLIVNGVAIYDDVKTAQNAYE